MDFKDRLKQARIERGLSVEQAASAAGVSFGYWYAVERGQKDNPNTTTLSHMAKALGVSAVSLMPELAAPAQAVQIA